jgi:hypothetical protein
MPTPWQVRTSLIFSGIRPGMHLMAAHTANFFSNYRGSRGNPFPGSRLMDTLLILNHHGTYPTR